MVSCPPLAAYFSPTPFGSTMATELINDLVGEWKRIFESESSEVLT